MNSGGTKSKDKKKHSSIKKSRKQRRTTDEKEKEGRAWKKTKANRSMSKRSIIQKKQGNDALDEADNAVEEFSMKQRVIDPETGQSHELDDEEMRIIQRLLNNEYADENFNPHQPFEEFFSGKDPMTSPLVRRDEPKRRFLPSKFETRRILRLVRGIRKGRLILNIRKGFDGNNGDHSVSYDVWEKKFDLPEYKRPEYIPAPKMNLPVAWRIL